jgi:hypothetical protein
VAYYLEGENCAWQRVERFSVRNLNPPQGDTTAALDLVRAFVRIEPLGFYRQLAENQWRGYGFVQEEVRTEG